MPVGMEVAFQASTFSLGGLVCVSKAGVNSIVVLQQDELAYFAC